MSMARAPMVLALPIVLLGWAVQGPQRQIGHPRLLISRTELPAIRAKIAQQPWARKAFEALRKSADESLAKPIELPDRGYQWSHWYSCKKHGARLRTESPTRHVCPVDGEVYTGWPYDDVPLTAIHNGYASSARELGIVYQITGEPRYAAKARGILLAYADRYLSYRLHNNAGKEAVGGGRVTSQTLNEAIWLISMAQGADAIWDRLSATDIERLRSKLFYPAAVDVIQKHRMGIHNIQCWKNSAVGLVGFLFDDAKLIGDAIDGPTGYRKQVEQGVNADGQWWEGAWGYHFYTMDALWPLTEAAKRCGMDLYGQPYRRMFRSPIELAMPDGTLPAFNDSAQASARGNPNYEIALARYGDSILATPIRARTSLQALVAGVPTLPKARAAAGGTANHRASGYAVLRSGPGSDAAWLCLKYGPHGGGHGHPDKGSFVLYAGGGVLAGDPGTAAYGVPLQSEWYRTTLAHNTIVLDEASQRAATGTCLEFSNERNWRGAAVDAGQAFAQHRFRRVAVMLADDVAVFADFIGPDGDVAAGSATTIDVAYHPSGSWETVPEGVPATLPAKPGYMHMRGAVEAHARLWTQGVLSLATQRKDAPGRWWLSIAESGVPTRVLVGTGIGSNTEDRVPMVVIRRNAVATACVWAVGLRPDLQPMLKVERAIGQDGASLAAHEAALIQVRYRLGTGGTDRAWRVLANPEARPVRFGASTVNARLAVEQLRSR